MSDGAHVTFIQPGVKGLYSIYLHIYLEKIYSHAVARLRELQITLVLAVGKKKATADDKQMDSVCDYSL